MVLHSIEEGCQLGLGQSILLNASEPLEEVVAKHSKWTLIRFFLQRKHVKVPSQ